MMRRLAHLAQVRKNNEGFTLVELMIVVAIIGILAAIAIPQFAAYRKRGYVATINSDVKNAFTASSAFIADNPAATTIDIGNLTNSGYTNSPGVTTTVAFIDTMNYTITSSGLLAWSLNTPSASMTSNSLYIPAKP